MAARAELTKDGDPQPRAGVTAAVSRLARARELAQKAVTAARGIDPDYAMEACDDALGLLYSLPSSEDLVDVLRWKGSVLRDRGRHAEAYDQYAQSLAIADQIGYRLGRAHAINCLGTIAYIRGNLDSARRWYDEALRLGKLLDDPRLCGMVEQNLGVLEEAGGDARSAMAHFERAISAFSALQDDAALLWALSNLAALYTREGVYPRARTLLERALRIATSLKDAASEGIVEENRAELFLRLRLLEEAEGSAIRALGVAEQRKDQPRRAAALAVLARIMHARDRESPYVLALLDNALSVAQPTEDIALKIDILCALGDGCHEIGRRSKATRVWGDALELARSARLTDRIAGIETRLQCQQP